MSNSPSDVGRKPPVASTTRKKYAARRLAPTRNKSGITTKANLVMPPSQTSNSTPPNHVRGYPNNPTASCGGLPHNPPPRRVFHYYQQHHTPNGCEQAPKAAAPQADSNPPNTTTNPSSHTHTRTPTQTKTPPTTPQTFYTPLWTTPKPTHKTALRFYIYI